MKETYHLFEGLEHVDFARVQEWLSSSYWTPGIGQDRIEHASQHSALVLSVHTASGIQAGFLRVVSDKARFAYLCDVWVDSPHRGQGLARRMVQHALQHPDFATVTTWTLGTKDAQKVYAGLGFRDMTEPGAYPYTFMVRRTA
ncbi:GNAT family N-acetyltransferase [Verrucomicrobium sp. BvORR106]|uniref:GNAT family N-acetyltransferase n=1 Tax=Verrucomicrobium sp. BvORR106 TaxID=1403819 RepID=UPI00068C9723|nr:GNAT family N-acetyltransferase [Verrucomicrobium sp. BvORR106]